MRAVTWRSWAINAVCIFAYLAIGYFVFASSSTMEAWIYRIGLTACTFMPLIFIVTYTLTKNKWWTNDLGASLVRVKLAVIPFAAPLAWVFWFDGGVLRSSFLAWLAVAGPGLTAGALLYVTVVFGRISRMNAREAEAKDREADPDTDDNN